MMCYMQIDTKNLGALLFVSIVLMAFIAIGSVDPCFGQQKVKNGDIQTLLHNMQRDRTPLNEDVVLNHIDKLAQKDQFDGATIEEISTFCFPTYAENAGRQNSEKIKEKLLNFPVHNPQIGAVKISSLSKIMHMEGVIDYILAQLSSEHPEMRKASANAIIKYGGDWDLVKTIVNENEIYGILGTYKVTEGIPMLLEAVKSGSWNGKINAATVLEKFGYLNIHIEVISDILTNAPPSDDKTIIRPVHLALIAAQREQMTFLSSSIYRFASVDNALVSHDAISTLMSFTIKSFSSEARNLLEKLAIETSNEATKMRVDTFLRENQINWLNNKNIKDE